jgi:hypothetical protein
VPVEGGVDVAASVRDGAGHRIVDGGYVEPPCFRYIFIVSFCLVCNEFQGVSRRTF